MNTITTTVSAISAIAKALVEGNEDRAMEVKALTEDWMMTEDEREEMNETIEAIFKLYEK